MKTLTTPVLPRHKPGRIKTRSVLTAEVVHNVSLRIHGEVDGPSRTVGHALYAAIANPTLEAWLSTLSPAQLGEGASLWLASYGTSKPIETGIYLDWLADHDFPECLNRLSGLLNVRPVTVTDRVPYDRTWYKGDAARHSSYNIDYWGTISSIGPKTVLITDDSEANRSRLDFWTFWSRNRVWTLEQGEKRNREWVD